MQLDGLAVTVRSVERAEPSGRRVMTDFGVLHETLIEQLRSIVGATHTLVGADAAPYAGDWTGRWHQRPGAVVRPADAPQTAAVVGCCAASGIAIVPRGGNTGLVGGSVAGDGDVLVDLRRLQHLGPVRDGSVTVGAGVTIGDLQRHVAAAGWRYAVDFGARDSATVGGSIATNAGGIHVFRYGMTRSQVLGVDIVDGAGRLISAGRGLLKDNTGPDLATLVCGSEGTLGIITGAVLRLIPAAVEHTVALLGFDTLADAVAAVSPVRAIPTVEAIELIDARSWAVMSDEFGHALEGRPGAVLAIESTSDPEGIVEHLGPIAGVVSSAVGGGAAADRLWVYRDQIAEVLARRGRVTKFDVSVPHDAMIDLIRATDALAAADSESATLHAFGHAADGNLHLNLLDVDDEARLADGVYREVLRLGGSVSAEHGIGRAKGPWLAEQKSDAEVAALTALRNAFDPHHVLNPKVLDIALRPTDPDAPTPSATRRVGRS